MIISDNKERRFLSILVFALVLSLTGFIACGGGDSQPADEAQSVSEQKTDQVAETEKAPSSSPTNTPAGWKTVKYEAWSISFPDNWNGDPDRGLWEPGEVGPFMGRPDVSVHLGGMPVMPPESFDDRIKSRINGEPQDKVDVKISDLSGIKCSWEQMGKKHRGIFLEEKIAEGMIVIHFFDCQAPTAEFDQYKDDFEKILDSIKQ